MGIKQTHIATQNGFFVHHRSCYQLSVFERVQFSNADYPVV